MYIVLVNKIKEIGLIYIIFYCKFKDRNDFFVEGIKCFIIGLLISFGVCYEV